MSKTELTFLLRSILSFVLLILSVGVYAVLISGGPNTPLVFWMIFTLCVCSLLTSLLFAIYVIDAVVRRMSEQGYQNVPYLYYLSAVPALDTNSPVSQS